MNLTLSNLSLNAENAVLKNAQAAVEATLKKYAPLNDALLSQLSQGTELSKKLAALKDKYSTFVVVGIGGSSLGVQVLEEYFAKTDFIFFDNVDAFHFEHQMATLKDLKKTLWLFISNGGVAYIRALRALEKAQLTEEEQQQGLCIIRRALEEPLRQIAANAGFEGSIVVEKVKGKSGAYGFNAETAEYGDMIQAGIIDPTKVSRFALQNAASVAALMLTTEAMVAEKPKKKKPAAPAMPPDMGDYD